MKETGEKVLIAKFNGNNSWELGRIPLGKNLFGTYNFSEGMDRDAHSSAVAQVKVKCTNGFSV